MELAVQMRGAWADTRTAATWAESRGLAAFAMPDHYLRRASAPDDDAFDHLTHLAALAATTERIELVSLVSPVTFRHPAVLLKMAVTIDDISGGRFTLGVGTGWLDAEFELFGIPYPDTAIRYEMLEECLAYLQAALTPGPTPYEGHHYRLAGFDPHPHPRNLRLLVGGSGAVKTPRLAGAYADEFNIYACPPDEFAAKAAVARNAAARSGRDPDKVLMSGTGPALAAVDDDVYRDLLTQMAELTGSSAEHIEETYLERGWPHGPGSQAARMLDELEAAGCERYYLQMFGSVDLDAYDAVLAAYGGAS
jgi:alkanesulfonate monooxygenase SsuD/methylene tetrahydromethanopterin reductase-like flavin-dependent oxidoreductase (luciferase family)